MVGRPSSGLMLVYIDVGSEVNNLAEAGSVGSVNRMLMRSCEFLIYAGIEVVSGCSLTSRKVETKTERLPH